MYRTLLILMAALLLFIQCSKNKPKDQCLEGKIIRTSCASLVVQVLNNNSVGEDGWKDVSGGNSTTYDNVFNVGNRCKIPDEIKPGSTFYFTVHKPQISICATCYMYDAPPKKVFDIKNATLTPCKD